MARIRGSIVVLAEYAKWVRRRIPSALSGVVRGRVLVLLGGGMGCGLFVALWVLNILKAFEAVQLLITYTLLLVTW
ncbi:MAG: hypothetical protein ABIH46_03565, partial [Chloroflexota bacterium]